MTHKTYIALTIFAILEVAILSQITHADEPFEIQITDADSGRGVPLVELSLTSGARYYTDSQGIVAFHEPGWMDRRVFFHIDADGYEQPKNAFGFRGENFVTTPGGKAKLAVKRTIIAERLYRVTGAGIYRDSVLTARPVPVRDPLLNSEVVGSDSVLNAIYHGKIYWFWGDTSRVRGPLGNFNVPGAVSSLPADGGLDPQVGVQLDYFADSEGFAKATAPLPGAGPTWLSALAVVPGAAGEEELFAAYMKIKPPLTVYQRGLCRWNDEKAEFEKVVEFPLDAPIVPNGHPFRVQVDGEDYLYYAGPCPLVRVRATAAALADLKQYEAFTCLATGTRWSEAARDIKLDRDEAGRLRYAWRKNTSPVDTRAQARLVRRGLMKASEGLLQLRDRDTAKSIEPHAGSVYWNEYRKRWVMIFTEHFGSSMLGEVWYAEADRPEGPWIDAVKVVTHKNYSFYNPKQDPMFDQEGGRIIFFEGTYSHTFSGNEHKTPWYDYNQIMYKLDLADPRLALPR